jgi:hypothetical protein
MMNSSQQRAAFIARVDVDALEGRLLGVLTAGGLAMLPHTSHQPAMLTVNSSQQSKHFIIEGNDGGVQQAQPAGHQADPITTTWHLPILRHSFSIHE